MKKKQRKTFLDAERAAEYERVKSAFDGPKDPIDSWSKAQLLEACKRQRDTLDASRLRAENAEKQVAEFKRREAQRALVRDRVLHDHALPKELRDYAARWLCGEVAATDGQVNIKVRFDLPGTTGMAL